MGAIEIFVGALGVLSAIYIPLIIFILSKINKISGIEEGLKYNKLEIDKISNKLDSFIMGSFSINREIPKVLQILEELDKFKEAETPTGNPVTTEEIKKFRHYRNKIAHSEPFSANEYEEFQLIANKIKEEIKGNERKREFDYLISGLIGFVGGLVVGAFLSKNDDEDWRNKKFKYLENMEDLWNIKVIILKIMNL